MAKTFFCIKRGDHLSLGSLPGKGADLSLADSPRLFFSHPQDIAMDTPSKDKYAVDLPSLTKSLKHQILCTKNYIAYYQSEPQAFEEVLKGKEQLRQQEKLLSEIEEALKCQ